MSNTMHSPNNTNRSVLLQIMKVVLFLIPVLIYLPTFGGNTAAPPGDAAYSDLLITHYPNILYLRKALLIDRQLPFWSALIQSGAPFAANPLAGVFYLPGWLAMVFPLPAGLSIVLAGHIVLGTWGMDRFLGLKGISTAGRYLGALSFGLLPKMAAHFGAGHITLLYAISWTPWLLYCSEKDLRGWSSGMIAGMIFLADPRWLIYAGLFWFTYHIAHRQLTIRNRWKYFLRFGLIAGMVSAPLLIPLLEYVRLATRSALSASDMLIGSLPVSNLIGVIIPGSGGNTEWYVYSGGVLLALFFSQVLNKAFLKRYKFWIIWLGISVFLAFGSGAESAEWLAKIPVLSLLRVPARSLFLTGISLAVISAYAVDELRNHSASYPKQRLILFSIIVMGLLMIAGIVYIAGDQPLMIVWGFIFLSASGVLLLLSPRIPDHWNWEGLLILLLVIDLLGAGLAAYRIKDQELRNPAQALSTIIEDDGYFRIYSPSYSIPQYLTAEYDLELADGVDPLQIASYVDFVQKATGVPQEKYSVTIPPFQTGDPSQDNQYAQIDSQLLGLLNVKYLASEFDLQALGLTPLSQESSPKIYQNDYAYPRAWMQTQEQGQEQWRASDVVQPVILNKTANTMLLNATGPGTLVVSEINYPGWRVYVDGKQAAITVSYQIFRSVELSEGDHKILFKFAPYSVYIGLGLSFLGWIIIGYTSFRNRFDKVSL